MSGNATDVPQLPNPLTPMAFLPPDLAFQVTIAIYILVGSLGVMIWDILNNLKSDYILLTKYRITLPTITYVISRLGSLGYVLASTIFETAPTGNCIAFEKGLDWLYPIAIPASSLLFFFRVRAIFDKNIFIVTFFGFMWLAVVAGCLTVTQGVTGAHIGSTDYCINASLEGYVAAAAIIPLVNDTLIFLAISWRLMTNSHVEYTLKGGMRTLVFGDYMPAFSRSLLQDGQIYYLTTVSTSLLTVIMLYVSSVPIAYRTMFTVPNIMLMNIMACRVFRNTKFGLFRENTISTSKMRSKDDRTTASIIPLSLTGNSRGKGQASDTTVINMDGIEVTKTVERLHDYPSDNKMERYPSRGSGTA
ncbi:hypothetical protein GALMADRAFT_72738 [Galerina marginata CBS 339.88]|uniref:G-protein coupled receptors family 1 profile domain-containing protein n=1 Tax=Galerina marginata (strain CBS 339.88) TaxID=685588 RepID=A0A067T292_GALM3|nr:hypothetical protein GALMADRAFT_72738 [Galerina marginata CBS 339.88]